MGPVLKTLFGLFLFVWSVLGILTLVGGVYVALQLPNLQNTLSETLGGGLSGGGINQSAGGTTGGSAPELDAETTACLEAELGANFFEQLGPDKEPTEEQRAAIDKCGLQLPPDQGSGAGTKASPSPKKS